MAGTCDPQSRLCSTPVSAQEQLDLPRFAPEDGGPPPIDAADVTVPPSDGALPDALDVADAQVARDVVVDGQRCVGTMPEVCNGRCADLGADPAHCGRCNNPCATTCSAGRCVTAAAVSVGHEHTCVLASDGTVYSAGRASALGAASNVDRTILTRVVGVTGATAVRCSFNNGCAFRDGMPPQCWGTNGRAQAGVRSAAPSVDPAVTLAIRSPVGATPAFDPLDVRGYVSTYTGACMSNAAEVYCWGRQLGWLRSPFSGNPPAVEDAYATLVGPVLQLTAIDEGSNETSTACALRSNGQVGCWGDGLLSYAGGTGTPAPPVAILAGAPALRSIADTPTRIAGARHIATCGIDAAGGVWCGSIVSGSGLRPPVGPMGAQVVEGSVRIALPVAGAALGVALTVDAACAIQSDGAVVCWGQHMAVRGTLGRRTLSEGMRYGPQPVEVCDPDGSGCAPLTGVTQISGSLNHFCARTSAGAAVCWGENASGQLGSGDRLTRQHAVRMQW